MFHFCLQPKLPDDGPPMVDLSKLPKNNAVNKFWASVEPYCADISNEDLKFLEDLLRSHEDDSDYFKVGVTEYSGIFLPFRTWGQGPLSLGKNSVQIYHIGKI